MSNRSMRKNLLIAAGTAALVAGSASAADVYDCTVTPAASSLSYDFSATAPTTGTLRGNNIAPLASRTKRPPQSFLSCGSLTSTQNDLVPFTGTGVIAGSGSNIQPTGTFQLELDISGGQSRLNAASFDLLGTSTVVAGAVLDNFSVPAFCGINPGCLVPFALSIDLPLGDAEISEVLAEVDGGPYVGTLTPTGPNQYSYSINAVFAVTPSVEFLGSPFNTGTQLVPVVFSGTATVSGSTVAVTSALNVEFTQTEPDPVIVPDSPFTITGVGICEGFNLLLATTITSSVSEFASTANVVSMGTVQVVVCPGNYNGDGVVDLLDLLAFNADWSANLGAMGPNLPGDFNEDGVVDLLDLLGFNSDWSSNLGQACP